VCSGGTPYCSNGVCAATCAPGYADCNSVPADGCEAQLSSNAGNCSACGVTCGTDATCGCAGSLCSGGTIYFSEDFSDNAKGWTLGPEWAIGPTAASPPGTFPTQLDPATDHSPTLDNGVAGTVLGGNYATSVVHAAEYLTSPAVNLSAAGGTVYLTFWQWLNSDYPPFITDTVDVWNGSVWINLFTNPAATVMSGFAWTRVQYDVTAYKNAALKVRFGLTQGSVGAYILGGWNVDDVSLSSATCN
jgi:hypothetical protein